MSVNTEKNIVIDSIMSESDLESQSLNESGMPVSYTHLDVYKRQIYYTTFLCVFRHFYLIYFFLCNNCQ